MAFTNPPRLKDGSTYKITISGTDLAGNKGKEKSPALGLIAKSGQGLGFNTQKCLKSKAASLGRMTRLH